MRFAFLLSNWKERKKKEKERRSDLASCHWEAATGPAGVEKAADKQGKAHGPPPPYLDAIKIL